MVQGGHLVSNQDSREASVHRILEDHQDVHLQRVKVGSDKEVHQPTQVQHNADVEDAFARGEDSYPMLPDTAYVGVPCRVAGKVEVVLGIGEVTAYFGGTIDTYSSVGR